MADLDALETSEATPESIVRKYGLDGVASSLTELIVNNPQSYSIVKRVVDLAICYGIDRIQRSPRPSFVRCGVLTKEDIVG